MRRFIVPAIVVLVCATGADAGIWEEIWRGLDYAATPSGFPVSTTGSGFRVNGARSGRVRIVPNGVVGRGYRLEFDRTFGVDSSGRPETFRFSGLGDMTLQGSTQLTAGYTHYKNKLYFGTLDFSTNNLTYNLRTKIGAQDAALTGRLNVANQIEINPLGFYTMVMNVSNDQSQLQVDGVLVRSEKDLDFDIGPISVQGNLFFDMAVGLLNSLGLDTSNLEALSPQSPIEEINDAIDVRLQGIAAAIAGETAVNESAALLTQTVLTGDQESAQRLIGNLTADLELDALQAADPPQASIPEPGTLLLMTVGGASLWTLRRRG